MMCGRSPCDKPGCTWSEAHRAICEASTVAAWEKQRRMDYYDDVRKKRGDDAARKLAAAVNEVRKAGIEKAA